MYAIICIIAVITLVSLYDYFVSKSWQQATSSVRNELVFEHRNRDYGAYQIRKEYDRNMVLIMLGILFSVGLLYLIFSLFKPRPLPPVFHAPEVVVDVFVDTWKVQEKIVPVVHKEEKVTAIEKKTAFQEPQASDKQVTEKTKSQEELSKSTVGAVEIDQKGKTLSFSLPIKQTSKVPELIQKKESPVEFADVEAEFPGGLKEMVRFIQSNLIYPREGISIGAEGKCYLRFVVDESGFIQSVRVLRGISGCPECDREAVRVVNLMPQWKPGSLKGKNVSTYFDLPINFQLQ
jgi:protein TonB